MATKKVRSKRLSDIKVEELSLVDEPAIGEYFAIVKRDEEAPVADPPAPPVEPAPIPAEPVVVPEVVPPADPVVEPAPTEVDITKVEDEDPESPVKMAFMESVEKLRAVAAQMNPDQLGLLAGLMQFCCWQFEGANEVMYAKSITPQVDRVLKAARWDDAQWQAVEQALAPPAPPAAKVVVKHEIPASVRLAIDEWRHSNQEAQLKTRSLAAKVANCFGKVS